MSESIPAMAVTVPAMAVTVPVTAVTVPVMAVGCQQLLHPRHLLLPHPLPGSDYQHHHIPPD